MIEIGFGKPFGLRATEHAQRARFTVPVKILTDEARGDGARLASKLRLCPQRRKGRSAAEHRRRIQAAAYTQVSTRAGLRSLNAQFLIRVQGEGLACGQGFAARGQG